MNVQDNKWTMEKVYTSLTMLIPVTVRLRGHLYTAIEF